MHIENSIGHLPSIPIETMKKYMENIFLASTKKYLISFHLTTELPSQFSSFIRSNFYQALNFRRDLNATLGQ